jgi:transposase
MPVAPVVVLTASGRRRLVRESHRRSLPPKIVRRIRIVLLAADGKSNRSIARQLGTSSVTVGLWRRRFAKSGFDGIRNDAARSGRSQRVTPTLIREIIETTLRTGIPGGGRWSSRRLADHLGISHSTVQRVWRRHGLRVGPHREPSPSS